MRLQDKDCIFQKKYLQRQTDYLSQSFWSTQFYSISFRGMK